ncbi:OmpA family protein [Massilia antarctica]|uniref:OmpA family protein n=1 Tax=Massilia antarctica TaxID=2765360 RepID=UPI0006BB70E5|nr:OmpA family protein [Massilia sp. H27-R4]MCY0913277.1 OmpA family protein [Massilia sp. H27-R4]CUI07909.1 OmpA/MotB [Janthinobacterium sp. CG23_2]CUU31695.1 OmpA/MotB [Janthinobacterium sp. CG23_2]
MTKQRNAALCLSISLAFAFTGCKPKAPVEPVPAPVASAPAPAAPPAVVQAPLAATPPPVSASADVDLDKIAVISKPMPPFPFVDYPENIGESKQQTKASDFDQLHLIVGNKVQAVEGRFRRLVFELADAKVSRFQAQRDYAKAALDMGGVKINTSMPKDEAFQKVNGVFNDAMAKTLDYPNENYSYESYFFPTPTGRKWMLIMANENSVRVTSIEEKQTASMVKMVTAAVMKSELDSKGHVALYINFDTDKAAIRPDGKPAVDEIAALMKKETALHLSVEGHTDNVGDKARNVSLSRERAQAVVQALVSDGIDGARLNATGHGAEKPLVDNGSEENRAKNRRVELVKVVKS